MSERSVKVRLWASVDQYIAAMDKAKASTRELERESSANMARLGRSMQSAGSTMTVGVTLPLVGVGAAALKTGNDFNTAFGQMVGLAGVAADDVDALKASVLDLAGETAVAPQELAEALYFAASAGLDTAGAMDTVSIAARASAAGLGSTQDVVGLVASAVASYGEENINAAEAADILTSAIREGRAEPAELAGALGRVLPVAASLGVEFAEVGGTVAYLSNIFGDTDRTVTAVNDTFAKLAAPTDSARQALEDAGTSADELKRTISEDGLLAGLDLLRDRGFAGNAAAIRELMPDMQGATALTALLDDASGSLADTLGAVGASAGSLDTAYQAIDEDAKALKQSWVDMQVALIKVGEVLAPIVADAAGFVGGLAEAFSTLDPTLQRVVLGVAAMAAAAGPLLVVTGSILRNVATMSSALSALRARSIDPATGAMTTFGKSISGATVALGFASAALAGYVVHQQRQAMWSGKAAESMEELSRAADTEALDRFAFMLGQAAMAGQSASETVADFAQSNLEGARRVMELADAQGRTSEATDLLAEAIVEEERARAQSVRTTEEHADAADALAGSERDLAVATNEAATATGDFGPQLEDAATGMALAADEAQRLADIESAAADATDIFGRTFAEAYGPMVDWAGAVEEAAAAATDLRTDIESAFSGASTAISSFSDEAMEDVGLFIQELQDNAAAAFDWQNNLVAIAQATSGDFALYLAEMGDAGYGLVDNLANGSGPQLQAAFDSWVVATSVTSRDMASEFAKVDSDFRDVLDGIPDGMSSSWQSIRAREGAEARSVGKTITDEAVRAIEGGYGGMVSAGQMLARGMADGMDTGAWYARLRAAAIASSVVATVRATLDMHSPSRVMMELGEFVSIGFAEGIEGAGGDVIDAMLRVIEDARTNAVGAAEAMVDELQSVVDGIWDGIDADRRLEGLEGGVADAERDLAAAREDAAAALTEHGARSDEYARAVDRVSDAEERLKDTNLRLAKAYEPLLAAGEITIDQFRLVASAADIEIGTIDRLIEKILELARVRSEAQVDTINAQAGDATSMVRRFDYLRSRGHFTADQFARLAELQGSNPAGWFAHLGELLAEAERNEAKNRSIARATGGSTSRGQLYEVAEHGRPEMYVEAGRTFLIPGSSGNVVPFDQGGGLGTVRLDDDQLRYLAVELGRQFGSTAERAIVSGVRQTTRAA